MLAITTIELNTAEEELERLQEENKYLEILILKDYISKFIIREKIEELKKEWNKEIELSNTNTTTQRRFQLASQCQILEELLEGK